MRSETGHDRLKTHLRGPGKVLRSRPPDLVHQEIWAYLIVHHAITALIAKASAPADLDRTASRSPRPRRSTRPQHHPPGRQAEPLAAVAEAAATAGDIDHGEALARSITHPKQQAQALTAVATVVVGTGAGVLLARAWLVDEWFVPLEALVVVDPGVLAVIVGEVVEELGRS